MAKPQYLELKPENVSNAVWLAVVEAWRNGQPDRRAAFRATEATGERVTLEDITKWGNENPDIKELKANLQELLLAKGQDNISDAIDSGDIATTKWYMERKAADEFSTKQAVAFEGAAIELSIEDKEKALKEMVENFKADGK